MELLTLTSMFGLNFVKGMLQFLFFVHYITMIQTPFEHVISYYSLLLDFTLIGFFLVLDFVLHQVCEDVKKVHRQTKLMGELRNRFEENNNRLLEEKENQLQSLSAKLDQAESELETKRRDVSDLRNTFGDLLVEQGVVVAENKRLHEWLQSEDMFVEFDHLLGEKEDQLRSLRTRINNAELERDTKAKDANVAEAHVLVLKKLFGQLFNEQSLVLEENESLKQQLQSSSKAKLKHDQLLDENKILKTKLISLSQVESELETTTKNLNEAEADLMNLSNAFGELLDAQGVAVEANQSLQKELQSSDTKLKQLQHELETKTREICAAKDRAIVQEKQSEEAFAEYDRMLADKEEELESLKTKLDQLQFELNGAEDDVTFMRNLFRRLLDDQDEVHEKNRTLKSWLQASFTALKNLEYEIATKTEDLRSAHDKIMAVNNDSHYYFQEYVRLLEENKILESKAKWETAKHSEGLQNY
ncbi:uncharacterized protein [Pyrus communis]|uniref:uncharacterized protein n=1 Tax=Pyrus communis TaxID=23211 RepID=UPI0035C086C9